MRLRNTETTYGLIAQLLHWIIVVLVVVQFALALQADILPRSPPLVATLAWHKSVGITILVLTLLRLAWRWINPVRAMQKETRDCQLTATRISHGSLYALLP